MPYASSIGMPSDSSSSSNVAWGSGALAERMNRSVCCVAGMRVGRTRQHELMNAGHRRVPRGPLRLDEPSESEWVEAPGMTTVPPEASVASTDATSPWMWNSGMTHTVTSDGPSP